MPESDACGLLADLARQRRPMPLNDVAPMDSTLEQADVALRSLRRLLVAQQAIAGHLATLAQSDQLFSACCATSATRSG